MTSKHHTIIVVPHSRARFKKWRVTTRQLTVAGVALTLLTILSILSTGLYFTTSVSSHELERVRSENRQLRQVNQSFETNIRKLQEQLSEYESRTRQLAIVAGLENLGDGPEAGIGGEEQGAQAADELPSLEQRAQGMSHRLDEVAARLDERLRWISATPAVAPVKGILTSGFGDRTDPMTGEEAIHRAVDIAAAPGQPVHAPADGIVTRAGRIGGLGNAVYLSHGFGITTRYGHMSRLAVHPGQRVHRGDVLGYVGTTGRSTGYHLHYEVRVDGKPVNPLAYILEGGPPRSNALSSPS